MKILTVGDSFTYGDELTDIKQAWPYVLQNKLSCELTNLGKSSTGNTSMIRNVVEHAADYDLIIIAWSHYARIEFADNYGVYDTWPGHSGVMFNGPISYRADLLNYINRYHDDNYLYRQYLINILLIQHFIQQQNKQYLMLDSFGNNFGDFKTDAQIMQLLNQVDHRYYIGWLKDNMTDWTYATPRGPGGHFLEAGHQVVADKIYEHIRSLGWI
jgi:lysophospholipase L1-like esterase